MVVENEGITEEAMPLKMQEALGSQVEVEGLPIDRRNALSTAEKSGKRL